MDAEQVLDQLSLFAPIVGIGLTCLSLEGFTPGIQKRLNPWVGIL